MSPPSFLGPGYRVPLSRVRVSGSRTITRKKAASTSDPASIIYDSKISLELAADPEVRVELPGADAGTKRELGVTLAEDGRLQSVDVSVTGLGPEVLKAVTTLAGTAVGAVVSGGAGPFFFGRRLDGGRAAARQKKTPAEIRRDTLEQHVESARDAVIAASHALVLKPDKAAAVRVAIQERELIRLQAALAQAEADLSSERAAACETWTEADEEWLFLDDLQSAPVLLPGQDIRFGKLVEGLSEARTAQAADVLRRFGVVVCLDDAEGPLEAYAGKKPPTPAISGLQETLNQIAQRPATSTGPSLVARQPRAVNITLYRVDLEKGDVLDLESLDDLSLQFVSRTRAVVVDRHSEWVLIPLGDGGLFDKDVTKATVGSAGGIVTLETNSESTLPAALSAGAEAFAGGVKSAKDVVTGLGDIADADVTRRAARAEAEKKIRDSGAPAPPSAEAKAQAERKEALDTRLLEARIALLEAQARSQ